MNLTAYHLGVIVTFDSDRLQALPAIGATSSGFPKKPEQPLLFFLFINLAEQQTRTAGEEVERHFPSVTRFIFLK